MVRITEDLVRKKSEHNEGIINSLEELSLHQEDVEKIEHLNNWCKNLEILYLQANLISKIENLYKLKKLKYLNLALNNIEVVENLERCESLEKLDLTLNFIGDIQSVISLSHNSNLRHLYLTGNPCYDFKGYRIYVVSNLPQLESLDNEQITRTEKIKAMQIVHKFEPDLIQAENNYKKFREEQRARLKKIDPDVDDELFWKSSSENAPETRVEISRRSRKARGKDEVPKTEKKSVNLFRKDGRPLNINQTKFAFKFNDEDPKEFLLDIAVYKTTAEQQQQLLERRNVDRKNQYKALQTATLVYLDTNFIQVDLQPIYVKVLIKEKVFQFVFPEEICTDKSTAQRSQTTGHLVLRMPKAGYKPEIKIENNPQNISAGLNDDKKRIYLEVQSENTSMDFSKIVEYNKKRRDALDNPDVPPLEYF